MLKNTFTGLQRCRTRVYLHSFSSCCLPNPAKFSKNTNL